MMNGFPPPTVADIEMRGGIDRELRVLQWLYGNWLPRSGHVRDDQQDLEAFVGHPFAHWGYFELIVQGPVRRL
ncbi:MAG TPA: hypothetical protein VGJ05_18295 [Fimbriiglobus sp.]|jgi:hypothetical protein